MIEKDDNAIEFTSSIVFENAEFALKYSGPARGKIKHAVVSFPDLIHPCGFDAMGWGETLFSRRNHPVVYVLFKKANWYQSEGFFEAMQAARSFLGNKTQVTAYGASMGGYGAILAGKALKANHVLALCPQYTIQQDIVPFERRYRDLAGKIGPFIHDIDAEMDEHINYTVIFDPTHNIDRRHEAMFKHPKKWERVLLPGSSHGVLANILEMASSDQLLDLMFNRISPKEFRLVLRNGRLNSPRYIRRMGNLTLKSHKRFASMFISIAREKKYTSLEKKWRAALLDTNGSLSEIILHPGLPKTGSTAIQSYFKSTSKQHRRRGVSYPLEEASPRVFSHSWLSSGLRDGSLSALHRHLKRASLSTNTLIISDESLYIELPLSSPKTRENIRETLAPYSVTIIFCQRSEAAWKKSFYLQSLKNRRSHSKLGANRLWGTNLSYRDFFADEFVQELTNFETRIEEMANVFGAKSVKVVNMKAGQDIVPDFCMAAGLSYFEGADSRFVNLSMSDVDGEIQRQANQFTVAQSGFVKRISGMDTDFELRQLRSNRLKKLASMGADLPWQDFSYETNAPLKYTEVEFSNRIEQLQDMNEQIRRATATL